MAIDRTATARAGQPAVGMYSLVSRFNHSCRANAVYAFRADGVVVVRTTVDVAAGEEMCISYIDVLQPLARCAPHLEAGALL